MTRAQPTSDYLAIILIGGGSSWGRDPDKEKAIKYAITHLRDWEALFRVADVEVTVNVADVHGYDHCYWDHRGFHGTSEATGKVEKIDHLIELVTRRTPKWRARSGS